MIQMMMIQMIKARGAMTLREAHAIRVLVTIPPQISAENRKENPTNFSVSDNLQKK